MKNPIKSYFTNLLYLSLCALLIVQGVSAQKMDSIERDRFKSMLSNIKNAIKKDYYDPNFRGIDLDARFKAAADRLEQVKTSSEATGVIAQVLMDFDDPHLNFYPPATNIDVEYGWRHQMIGDKCFVTMVKPKSDAEAKGLKVGDQIVSMQGFRPSRKELWKMDYYFYVVGKRSNMTLSVLSPGETQPRELQIDAKVKRLEKVITRQQFAFDYERREFSTEVDYQYFKYLPNATIWKMWTFSFPPEYVNTLIGKIKGSSLIIDLRGTRGGYVETLERVAGYMFDKDLTIADLKGRKEMKPLKSKTKGKDGFNGRLIVLIDHRSTGVSELFARLVQLEKRGVVIGDATSGKVMQIFEFSATSGANNEIFYGATITNADMIMSDGKSFQRIGVQPDYLVIPTGDDLANRRDPALAKAIELTGATVSADDAGKFFQYRWRENRNDEIIEIDIK